MGLPTVSVIGLPPRAGSTADHRGTGGWPGSPPHVQGTPSDPEDDLRLVRITPACAGNTTPCSTSTPWCSDHPAYAGSAELLTPTLRGQI